MTLGRLRWRYWPLRAKVALACALVAGGTIAVAFAGMYVFLRTELLDVVHQRMDREARELLWEVNRKALRTNDGALTINSDMLPDALQNRILEIFDADGRIVYRAPQLKDKSLDAHAPPANRYGDFTFNGRRHRIGNYQHDGLRLVVTVPLFNYESTMNRLFWASIVALPSIILLSLAGGIWVGRRALAPVQEIIDVAQTISAEEFERRIPIPDPADELRCLTEVLNNTFDRLEAAYKLAIRFSADASHQLKTPVTVMRMTIEDLLKSPDLSESHIQSLNDLLHQTRRLSSLAEGLMLLARADAGALDIKTMETDIRYVVEGCCEDGQLLAERRGVSMQFEAPETLLAIADPPRVEQILLNLIENAVKYNYEGGIIYIRAFRYGKWARIIVSNTGNPIPEDRHPFIFDRFSRGDGNENIAGHGLGLAIARELAAAMAGDLALIRSDPEWTEFELILPAVRGAGAIQKKRTMPLNFLAPPPRRT
jgi:signal transduction histidine kinase